MKWSLVFAFKTMLPLSTEDCWSLFFPPFLVFYCKMIFWALMGMLFQGVK